jgi:hypothetical protein
MASAPLSSPADTKMMSNKYPMVQVASQHACREDCYFKCPHPRIIDGDNQLAGRLIVACTWCQRHLTHNLPRKSLVKHAHCTPMNHGGRRRPTAAMISHSQRRGIKQSANMLHNRSALLKLEHLIFINTNQAFYCTVHYQCIALILIVLLAIVVNAATNIAPAPHPPQHQTKAMHLGNVILLRKHQKVLGGGANSPQMQPSLHRQNSHPTWCYVVGTQHHQPTTPGAETIQTEGPHHDIGNHIVIVLAQQN